MASIEVNQISKAYGKVQALQDISFTVNKGEIFGLIGPDGAGKTTLFRILTTLLLPDNGQASVADFDVVKQYKKIRQIVGYMPGKFSLYQDLTVQENLEFFAAIFGTTIEENYDLIEEIYSQIKPFRTRPAGKLSGGMKQKLALSCALIHKPEVLFLDEPTTGVDAVSRTEFWEMLKKLQQKGITMLVSTPYMDEASRCDRIALMQKGNILSIDTPQQMIANFGHPLLGVSSDLRFRLLGDLRNHPATATAFSFGEEIHLTTRETISPMAIISYLESLGHHNVKVHRTTPTIEDCFMDLMHTENNHHE